MYIKTFRKKRVSVYEWKLQWLPSSKVNANLFIYTKSKTNCETFLYTKSQTLFKKLDNFCDVFRFKKPYTLRYGTFHEIFELGIYIQKAWHFALRDVFIYKKLDTSQKARQFAIRFYILSWWTRCLAFSSYVNMIGSVAKERHRFKFVQNRSKVFWYGLR